MAVVTPAHPLVAAAKLLTLVDLAIIVLGALAFYIVIWADRERGKAFAFTLSGKGRIGLAAVEIPLGIALLVSSILLENALAVRLTVRGEGVAPISLCILLAYLGFSSLGLALAALRLRPAPVLSRFHLILSGVAAAALLILIPFSQVEARRLDLLGLGAITIASLLLSVWQLRGTRLKNGTGIIGKAQEGTRTRVPGGESILREGDTLSGFPGPLLIRFSEPEMIGSGGVSRVFRARRKDTGKIVAVKVPLAMDEVTGMAFLREMRTWEELRHENIARILGANILPVPYVEMEYIPRSLDDLEKPTDIRTAAGILTGIARGLTFAHARGIIHRDLKPGNVLLTDALVPKIADWGLSRFLAGSTTTDISGFSPRYAAPEQLDPSRYGRPDERTDLYGAGCIFYELVTGVPPFTGDGIAEITGRILSTYPAPPSALNPAARPVDSVIMRCLEKEPVKRYQSARDLERDLLGFVGDGNPLP